MNRHIPGSGGLNPSPPLSRAASLGRVLIAVHCRDEGEIDRAKRIMEEAGASDVAVSREAAA